MYEEYCKIIKSKEFTNFQTKILKEYYGEKYFTEVFGKQFPVYCTKGEVKYPFENLCNGEIKEDKKISFENEKYYEEYKRIIGHNIHRPKMPGFMLEKFKTNESGKIIGMDTWLGTYDQNVYTSHILEYEIYDYFLKHEKDKEINLEELEIRNRIYKGKSKEEVLTTGINRASLLGVQMLVIYKDNKTNRYRVVTIKRSDNVAVRPGFYQFIPSGGFEISGGNIREKYNVLDALYKEYLEELILGNKGFLEYEGSVKNEKNIREIEEMINKGTAKLEFLGSVVDLCGLRNELSFALIIDDPKYSEKHLKFEENDESKKTYCFYVDEIKNKIDLNKLNPTSAGLWKLFIDKNIIN